MVKADGSSQTSGEMKLCWSFKLQVVIKPSWSSQISGFAENQVELSNFR
jgi:hypothetical protein